ncbi:retrovirus-related pol polyprotein from transposon TNT 1-94 [Tanacetum coccineum]
MVIQNGDIYFEVEDSETKLLKETPYELLKDEQKKQPGKNNEAKMTLYNALPHPDYSSKNHARTFLCAFPLKWKAKVTAIKGAKDLTTLTLDELIGNLKVYETILGIDGVVSKPIKDKIMPTALKANITRVKLVLIKHDKFDICKEKTKGGSSRHQRGCYNCGNNNHFIDDCPKSKRNKALVGGAWIDSKDGNEPHNDATCLMAFESQELEDETLNISKFKKSSIILDDMLNSQKLSQDKEGYSQTFKAYIVPNKETTKIDESLNVTFDESLPKSRTSPLVDDDIIEEQAIQNHDRTQNPNCDLEEVIPRVENIREIRDHHIDQVIGELDERTLRSHAQDKSNIFAFVSTIEPKNIKEAIKDESWTMAMQEELDQFIHNVV